jgi:single-strand DNA-binding protein
MNGNSVTLVGNLVADPEVRYTSGGLAVTTFAIARSYKVRDTEEERVSFFDCVTFGQTAENVAESLEKGNRVIVEGTLEQRRWETDEGQKRSKHEVRVDAVGPDLRWATADVTRNPRNDNGGSSSPVSADDLAEEFGAEVF